MIRLLTEDDVPAYAALRRTMLREEPLVFSSSPTDDVASSEERTREILRQGAENVIFGAFAPELVGAAGLYRDPHEKAGHKMHLWGMYVAPAHRGRGLAAGLLAAAIAHARGLAGVERIHLSVTTAASAARRLYARVGFEPWATEPDALRHEGRSVDEQYLALRLG